MAFVVQPMTDEQRKSVAFEFFRRFDRGGDVLDLFDEHADAWFPKWGVAHGRQAIGRMFGDVSQLFDSISHNLEWLKFYVAGDVVIVEGTTQGVTAKGIEWRGGVTHGGRWADVMEIRDFKIQRLFIYLDPDYGGEDTDRYPWHADGGRPTPFL
ncbi:hypothetical protein CDO52_13700 [Nocardiopsis gilva YIM 90087]|uniref:Nuclear transport factor 2 family protein n=1 Tax=Nocardiopsis gilva YIM 90087 TaxID=1235441 RepID=A0A223S6N3_9ACTN|nr:hypothetical protein [Nocardiopsis gilva]ASU83699.1 hypothetical protein CDO52_13700 [Nocardiopsis gilva YIM 90087]